jgi:hypothetical protein
VIIGIVTARASNPTTSTPPTTAIVALVVVDNPDAPLLFIDNNK